MIDKIQLLHAQAEKYARAGAYADAQKALLKVVHKSRANGSAWLLLGQVFGLQNAHADAENAFAQAARLNPRSLDAHAYLGLARMQQGKDEQAISAFKAALNIQPRLVMALANLVAILHKKDRQDDALLYVELWLEEEPLSCNAHFNAAVLHQSMNQLQAARKHYEQVLALGARNVSIYSTHLNLGVVCYSMRDFEMAITHCRQALAINPDCAVSYCNLGNAQKEQGNLDEAIASFNQALRIAPTFANAHSSILFCMNYVDRYDAHQKLARHIEWAERHATHHNVATSHNNGPDPQRTLRIGFVSADFREHPVGYFLEKVFQNHTATNCEIFCYSNSAQDDLVTQRLRSHVEHWRQIEALGDDDVTALIRSDRVDILIDLSGHTAGNRLLVFARKPAPLQVTWLGYFATTGLAAMDYILGDNWMLPHGEEHHFVEKAWRLSRVSSCFAPPTDDIKIEQLPALRNQSITFGTLNNLAKMNDRVIACWAGILKEIPNSKLYLNRSNLLDDGLRRNVIEQYAAHGIAENRLILEATFGRVAALKSYNRIDIALDTFPYPGGTTTIEAMWMGVPVLTLRGNNFLSHLGESIMHNAGLPDWVAANERGYIDKAVDLSANLEELASLRNGLRARVLASPLFDAPLFTRDFELALRGMWQKWCQQQ
jgi:protein O-GlcNAc transferase